MQAPDVQQAQPPSVVGGDYSLLEDLLDDVSLEGLSLEKSVEILEGISFLDGQTQEQRTFKTKLCKPVMQECVGWARAHPGLMKGNTEQNIQQLAAVRLWTGSAVCYVVTSVIRDRTRTQASVKPICAFLKFFFKGLHGLPPRFVYQGVLYRGETGVRDNWSTVMKEGFVFGFCAPTSFSKEPSVIQTFKKEGGPRTCYIIQDGVGYDLKEISIFSDECEVLLEGVTMVRVLNTNEADKVVGEAGKNYFRATCAMQCGVPMIQGSPVRAKEREIICKNPQTDESGQDLDKKDFEEAPFEKAEWRKRKRLKDDDKEYEDKELDTKKLSLIGKGNFAKTYRVKQLSTGKHFAAKMLKKSKLGPAFNEDRFKTEVRLVQALPHRNVIKCVGWYSTSKEFAIVMEYMPDGNLGHLMAVVKGVELGRTVAEQVGSALDYMHRECPQRVVHADVKPENVLVGATGSTAAGAAWVLKLADFGRAYVAPTTQGTQESSGGTPCYMSPEQFYSDLCGTKADMWALGCILVKVVTGERLSAPLCKDSTQVRERRTDLIERTRMASKGLGKVAAGLLEVNKHQRSSAKEMEDMVTYNKMQALEAAVAAGYVPEGHPINTPITGTGRLALHSVASKGDEEGVKMLLEAGASVDVKDSFGRTPLFAAAAEGHVECIRTLLELGADKESKYKDGRTPLYAAARNGHVECIRALVELGADKESKYKDGSTPLYAAALLGHVECVRALVELGADKESKNTFGWTTLHAAAFKGHAECARALVELGADKESKNKFGWTTLHAAAFKGHAECARALVELGADKESKNKAGLTALNEAKQALSCAKTKNSDLATIQKFEHTVGVLQSL